ncbi:MAG: adenosylcobinamide-GDP ribazoletransferase [Pseudomonadota bacterium]
MALRSIQHLFLSVQFLSRLPVPATAEPDETFDFRKSVWAFPIAGLLISLPAVSVVGSAHFVGLPASVCVVLGIVVQVLVTGALHEDGLADVCDGFGGGQIRRRKLAIMKDSAVGTYGVLALIAAFSLRWALLVHLMAVDLLTLVVGFLVANVLSRAVQVAFWHSLPAASRHSLAYRIGRPERQVVVLALMIAIVIAGGLSALTFAVTGFVLGLCGAIVVAFVFRRICLRQIRGQTGDTLGAVQVLSEVACLMGFAIGMAAQ